MKDKNCKSCKELKGACQKETLYVFMFLSVKMTGNCCRYNEEDHG